MRKNWELTAVLCVLGFMFGLALPDLHCQTAKVIQLAPEDTLQIIALRTRLKEAQADLDALNEKLRVKYTTTLDQEKGGQNDCSITTLMTTTCFITTNPPSTPVGCASLKPDPNAPPKRYKLYGWENGFEYSDDFKFIVPTRPPTYSSAGGGY